MGNIDLYKKYYLDQEDIINIINEGIIVFDTSALLDFYYYSDDVQQQLFQSTFKGLKGRLWIPAQCYFEFLKNKGKVSGKPRNSYKMLLERTNNDGGYVPKITSIAKNVGKDDIKDLKGQLKTLKETTLKKDKHPYLDQELFVSFDQAISDLETNISVFAEVANQFEECITKKINEKIDELKDETDDVQQFVDTNYEIGEELTYEMMSKICDEGRVRYSEKIPPGYEDGKDKTGMQKYGDLFAWKEILYMAGERAKDVLLITHDTKIDWWDKKQNAPCYELLKEFNSVTGKRFWSSSMKDFLYLLNKSGNVDNKISEEIIEEINDATKQMIEDSLKTEVDSLYTGVLLRWLDSETDYILGDRHDIIPEWRVFGKCYLYDAINYRGDETLILMNIVEKTNYANVYHVVNNMLEIKRYYDKFARDYRYRQVIVAKSSVVAQKVVKQIQDHTKLEKIYRNENIENDLVHLDDGQLIYVSSNHPMG